MKKNYEFYINGSEVSPCIGDRNDLFVFDLAHEMMSEDDIRNSAYNAFENLYSEACIHAAGLMNEAEEKDFSVKREKYYAKLMNNPGIFDCEKQARLRGFDEKKHVIRAEDISPADLERILCSAVPFDENGNSVSSHSETADDQIFHRKLTRKRISSIRARKSPVNRFDLITLHFFIYSCRHRNDPQTSPAERYNEFISETDSTLVSCGMGKIYPVNSYEALILLSIMSTDALGTYSDVLEKLYEA